MEFVSVKNMASWIADRGPEAIIAGMTDALEADFRRWPSFDKTPRIASHSPIGVIELMPTSDHERYGFKYVNGHPGNPARGYQTVTAFGVLADVMTGYPTFLAEMTVLTALRTAATSALAARWLAPAGASHHGMIGAGSQAEFQAIGVRTQLGIDRFRVFDVDPAASEKFARNLRPLGFTVEIAASAAEAVRDADIITTCTADKANATVLHLEDLPDVVHINAIGGDCPGKTELDPRILDAAQVFVEYTPQTRIEGEIQQRPADFAVTELWEVILGAQPGRTGATPRTVFDSVGFAIEDFSALAYVQAATAGTRWSEEIDLVADPDDPKDLFGYVSAPLPVR